MNEFSHFFFQFLLSTTSVRSGQVRSGQLRSSQIRGEVALFCYEFNWNVFAFIAGYAYS